MKTFTIDGDHNIAVYASANEVPAGDSIHCFASEKELGKVLEFLRGDELAELWNSVAGVTPFDDLKPVKKFTDRKTAVARIWKAVQRLNPMPQGATSCTTAADGSKKAAVIELVRRPQGATLAEIRKATGWQAHTVRGFVSGTLIKKQGLRVESYRSETKERTYRSPA